MKTLTHELLREMFVYDEQSGRFTRRKRLSRKCFAGTLAGQTIRTDGYRRLEIDGKAYYEHRLVWFYVHGVWPTDELDHIDGNRANNALPNLRECTRAQNSQNVVTTHNGSGFKGVFKRPNSWAARIRVNGKLLTVGVFADPRAAALAYDQAARQQFGVFAKTNSSMGLMP